MARPTVYSEEIILKAKSYLDNYRHQGDEIPQIAGLALYLGISRETVHTWVKEEGKEEFSDIVNDILSAQEQRLLNKGLNGDFNSNITKLLLSKHKYSDSKEIKTTEVPYESLTDEELESMKRHLLDEMKAEEP